MSLHELREGDLVLVNHPLKRSSKPYRARIVKIDYTTGISTLDTGEQYQRRTGKGVGFFITALTSYYHLEYSPAADDFFMEKGMLMFVTDADVMYVRIDDSRMDTALFDLGIEFAAWKKEKGID